MTEISNTVCLSTIVPEIDCGGVRYVPFEGERGVGRSLGDYRVTVERRGLPAERWQVFNSAGWGVKMRGVNKRGAGG